MSYAMQGSLTRGGGYQPQGDIQQQQQQGGGKADTMMWQQQHYMARIKQEREDQVQQVQRQRRKERLIREREEDLELVEIQRQLEEEQKKKLDKLLAHKDEMVKVIEDNEARAVCKEKQLAKEKAEDERMRLQYTEMLAKQEAARNEALSAMYAKSQNRAAAAGAMFFPISLLR